MKLVYGFSLVISCLFLFSCSSESFDPVKYELSFPNIEILEFTDLETITGAPQYFINDQLNAEFRTQVKEAILNFDAPFEIRPTLIVLDDETSGTISYMNNGVEENISFNYEESEDIFGLVIERSYFEFERNEMDGLVICQYNVWGQEDRSVNIFKSLNLQECTDESHYDHINNILANINVNVPVLGTAKLTYRLL